MSLLGKKKEKLNHKSQMIYVSTSKEQVSIFVNDITDAKKKTVTF